FLLLLLDAVATASDGIGHESLLYDKDLPHVSCEHLAVCHGAPPHGGLRRGKCWRWRGRPDPQGTPTEIWRRLRVGETFAHACESGRLHVRRTVPELRHDR